MTKYNEGYQAALADITAIIENVFDDSAGEGAALALWAVESYIESFTPKRKKPPTAGLKKINGRYQYKGYEIEKTDPGQWTIFFNGEVVDYAFHLTTAKEQIDNWGQAK